MTAPVPASGGGSDVDFERLARRLLAYVRKRCGHLPLASPDRMVQGMGIQDLASEGFVRAYAQRHRWTPDKGPLEDFLFFEAKKYMRRKPGHIVTNEEHRTTARLDGAVKQVQDGESTPIEALEAAEALERSEHRRRIILTSLDDNVERFIVTAIMNGDDLGAGEIAAKFGIPVSKVYEATSRLKKRKSFRDLVEKVLKQGDPHE